MTDETAPEEVRETADFDTVEALVRSKLAEAFGGGRGIVESAVPTIAFTLTYVTTRELKLALSISIGLTVLLLLVRLVQRSNPQFVINALVGIGIAAMFASRSGDARDVFLPGIIYNAAYAAVFAFSILIKWPVFGFMIGALVGDLTAWHSDRAMRRLCSNLTWMFVLPCVIRVLVQYPLWLGDQVALLGTMKVVMGWPLQIASLVGMGWILARNSTPLEDPDATDEDSVTA
jgi:hypothetical protein